MFKNPWGVNEGFKHLQEKLDELLPLRVDVSFLIQRTKH